MFIRRFSCVFTTCVWSVDLVVFRFPGLLVLTIVPAYVCWHFVVNFLFSFSLSVSLNCTEYGEENKEDPDSYTHTEYFPNFSRLNVKSHTCDKFHFAGHEWRLMVCACCAGLFFYFSLLSLISHWCSFLSTDLSVWQ